MGPLLAAVLVLSWAAAVRRASAAEDVGTERDPLECVNRKIFWFNDKVDVYVLAPVARGWEKVSPHCVRTSVSNFFGNLRFPIVTVNDLLQGKVKDGASDVGRFGVNTTVGVLGLFDPASGWGLVKHDEDFGQTLGVWGVPPGAYLVLPLLGPSDPRDAAGFAVDYALSVGRVSYGGPRHMALYADFDETGGLKPRAQVVIAGVKVGQVASITLDQS